jgi:hypothetical protein
MSSTQRILYCHCAYAHVVPKQTKEKVLRRLADSGVAFDAVPDLCEMAAKRDPLLKKLAEPGEGTSGGCKIAACYPRAVKWLFHAAGAPLPEEGIQVLNMREDDADAIADALLAPATGAGDDRDPEAEA